MMMNTSKLPVVILFLAACIISYLFIRTTWRNVCLFIASTLKEQKKLHCIVSIFLQLVCIFTIMTSPWRWPEYRPKHFGESIVKEWRHKYWSVFVGYRYIFDMVVTMTDENGL
jgi:hypothetical protein